MKQMVNSLRTLIKWLVCGRLKRTFKVCGSQIKMALFANRKFNTGKPDLGFCCEINMSTLNAKVSFLSHV